MKNILDIKFDPSSLRIFTRLRFAGTAKLRIVLMLPKVKMYMIAVNDLRIR